MPTSQQESFVSSYGDVAFDVSRATGIRAEVVLGQAAFESGYGLHTAKGSNNVLGIKGAGVVASTKEDFGRGQVGIRDSFKAFANKAASFLGWGNLMNRDIYAGVPRQGYSAKEQVTGIRNSGYATHDRQDYINKVTSIANALTKTGAYRDALSQYADKMVGTPELPGPLTGIDNVEAPFGNVTSQALGDIVSSRPGLSDAGFSLNDLTSDPRAIDSARDAFPSNLDMPGYDFTSMRPEAWAQGVGVDYASPWSLGTDAFPATGRYDSMPDFSDITAGVFNGPRVGDSFPSITNGAFNGQGFNGPAPELDMGRAAYGQNNFNDVVNGAFAPDVSMGSFYGDGPQMGGGFAAQTSGPRTGGPGAFGYDSGLAAQGITGPSLGGFSVPGQLDAFGGSLMEGSPWSNQPASVSYPDQNRVQGDIEDLTPSSERAITGYSTNTKSVNVPNPAYTEWSKDFARHNALQEAYFGDWADKHAPKPTNLPSFTAAPPKTIEKTVTSRTPVYGQVQRAPTVTRQAAPPTTGRVSSPAPAAPQGLASFGTGMAGFEGLLGGFGSNPVANQAINDRGLGYAANQVRGDGPYTAVGYGDLQRSFAPDFGLSPISQAPFGAFSFGGFSNPFGGGSNSGGWGGYDSPGGGMLGGISDLGISGMSGTIGTGFSDNNNNGGWGPGGDPSGNGGLF